VTRQAVAGLSGLFTESIPGDSAQLIVKSGFCRFRAVEKVSAIFTPTLVGQAWLRPKVLE
jgi:hypothetical protein